MPLISVLVGIQTQSALAGLTSRMRNEFGFGVVCANWGNVRAAPLAYSLAQEGYDHVVAATFEVINQLGSDVLLDLVVINYGELGDYPIRSQHFIELADLIAVVGNLLSVDRQRLSEYLRARLLALGYDVVLCEPRDSWIVVLWNVPKVFFAQAASIARQVWAPTANGVKYNRCRCRTAKCWIGL